MDQININYDKISISLFEIFSDLTASIGNISKLHNDLAEYDDICTSGLFAEYFYHFTRLNYMHYRCTGYLECLIITKCYAEGSLCYFKKDILAVFTNHFYNALDAFRLLRKDKLFIKNETLKIMAAELNNTSVIVNTIQTRMKLYSLKC
ncbi:MAG: hypothetical protein BGN88_14650 [Clostridiales bacterium 43-6]|nr:MAG: hypothetical protein BGN88_14650 [Clostridiales bacterium 43-6]